MKEKPFKRQNSLTFSSKIMQEFDIQYWKLGYEGIVLPALYNTCSKDKSMERKWGDKMSTILLVDDNIQMIDLLTFYLKPY